MAGQYQGIVDYMKSQGQDWSTENRKMLFAQFFPGVEFNGSPAQNNLLMAKMKDPNSPLGTGVDPSANEDQTNPNAGNANKVAATEEGEGPGFTKSLTTDAEGLPTGINVSRPIGDDKTQSFTVDEVQNATVTSSLSGQNIKPNDYAEGAGATGANSTTSNAVDFKAQKEVDDSKEELDKIKPPQTLFGMASKGMDFASPHLMEGAKAGLGAAKGLLGDVSLKDNASLGTMEGWKDLGGDALKGAGGLAAGAGGLLSGGLGMAFKGLSPIMSALGSGMNTMGRSMMGLQMPRY